MNKHVSGASLKDSVSEEEWKLRVELAAAYRVAAHDGWDDLIFTHFSVRIPGPEHHFLLNPFGLLFEEITASSLVKVDVNGNALQDTNYMLNPAGFTIHSAIHMAREDAHCIIHTHTKEGIAVASLEDGLLPMSQSALSVSHDVAYHTYEGIVFDGEEKDRLIPNIADKSSIILRNHGLLTMGNTVAQAFMRMHFLQRACEAQLLAQATGEKIIIPPDHVGERVHGQTNT
ncbi:MAG: class II aldolase/adducin family protein, partial [Sphingomonadales bacterium]|nr:class II aldolase/adducin family protein [Sphingomonadales bacterium]